jgi:hypothetical protein
MHWPFVCQRLEPSSSINNNLIHSDTPGNQGTYSNRVGKVRVSPPPPVIPEAASAAIRDLPTPKQILNQVQDDGMSIVIPEFAKPLHTRHPGIREANIRDLRPRPKDVFVKPLPAAPADSSAQ